MSVPFFADLSCDFESQSICGWLQDRVDDFDWSVASGETVSVGTGPQFDHTQGTGQCCANLHKLLGFETLHAGSITIGEVCGDIM